MTSTSPANADSNPTVFLGSDDIQAVFSWRAAIEALRQQYAASPSDDMFPPRTMARGEGLWLRVLSGVSPDGSVMGAKLIAANIRRRRASYLIPLFDQDSVELVALLDANLITGFRTAATTALAVDALAADGAVDVGVLGTGFEARNHVRALSAIRDIRSVTAFSPNPASRAAFIESLSDLGLQISAAEDARSLVEAGPSILLCAARARNEEPLFDGHWLQPGVTVASIGSTLPEQREVDTTTIGRARLIVADMLDEVASDTGDMQAARAANVDFERCMVTLSDVISGAHPGRDATDDIVLYKSVGSALQDITVAAMCFEQARQQGLGTTLANTIRPHQK